MYYCFALVYFRELTICIKMPAKQKNLKVDTTTATIKNIPQNNTKNKNQKPKKNQQKPKKKFHFLSSKGIKIVNWLYLNFYFFLIHKYVPERGGQESEREIAQHNSSPQLSQYRQHAIQYRISYMAYGYMQSTLG